MSHESTNEFEGAAAGHQLSGRDTSTAAAPVSNVSEIKAPVSMRRKVLVRLIFVGLSLVLGVAFVEVAGRFVLRGVADDARYYPRLEANVIRSAPILEPTRKPGTFDAKFGYVLSPHATSTETRLGKTWTQHTNSLGFRTREIEPRLPEEYRVLLVGDSFFYGAMMNEEETVGVQLELMRRSDPQVKRPFRVYNFARSGYCSVQELLVAQTYAAQVQPDIIILGFFAANDVIPNALTRIDEGHFVPVTERIEWFRNDLRAELGSWRHSLIFRTLSLTTPFGSRLVYRLGRQPWVLEQNYEVLRQFQSFSRDHGYRFGVVFQHTTDSLASGWRAAFYSRDDVHRPLSAFCEQSGIPFVDMRREFLEAGDWEQFILKGDGHCSAQGVRKTAEAIYQQLIRPELVRQDGPGLGWGKGASAYTFLDERHFLYHSTVISSPEREAPLVIDGLMHNDVVESDIHSTDTGGYTEMLFGVVRLLGFSYAPRI
jgi:hypothetical protein